MTNPNHKKFVEATFALLERYGISPEQERVKCAQAMMKRTKKFMQDIQSANARGKDIEFLFEPHVKEMNGILEQYGILDEDKRDEIIVDYFALVKTMGEG